MVLAVEWNTRHEMIFCANPYLYSWVVTNAKKCKLLNSQLKWKAKQSKAFNNLSIQNKNISQFQYSATVSPFYIFLLFVAGIYYEWKRDIIITWECACACWVLCFSPFSILLLFSLFLGHFFLCSFCLDYHLCTLCHLLAFFSFAKLTIVIQVAIISHFFRLFLLFLEILVANLIQNIKFHMTVHSSFFVLFMLFCNSSFSNFRSNSVSHYHKIKYRWIWSSTHFTWFSSFFFKKSKNFSEVMFCGEITIFSSAPKKMDLN